MQKHEVENTIWLLGINLPLAGWIAGIYAGGVPLLPLPQALTAAITSTPSNPFTAAGVLAGFGLAAGAAYLVREYGDDGFRGAAYRRWMRGSKIANWHLVKSKVNAANRRENRRRRLQRNGAEDLQPIMIGPMPMPMHLENRNTWGYNMIHNAFALVLKETKHAALLMSLPIRKLTNDGYGQRGTEAPSFGEDALGRHCAETVWRAKRTVDERGHISYWDGRRLYSKWDGKSKCFDYMD